MNQRTLDGYEPYGMTKKTIQLISRPTLVRLQ